MNETTYNIAIGSGDFFQEATAIALGLFMAWTGKEAVLWAWRKLKARLNLTEDSEVAIEALPVTAVLRSGGSTKVILAGWEDLEIECGPDAHRRLVQRYQEVKKGEELSRWIR